jgi:hypothetical protein
MTIKAKQAASTNESDAAKATPKPAATPKVKAAPQAQVKMISSTFDRIAHSADTVCITFIDMNLREKLPMLITKDDGLKLFRALANALDYDLVLDDDEAEESEGQAE